MYSFFAFILSMILLSYAILSYGLSINQLSLPYVKVEQLYIKLDKKLIFHVKRIDVTLGNDTDNTTSVFTLPKLSPIINIARKSFESIDIDELNIKDLNVTFRYTMNSHNPEDNKFTINSNDLNISTFYKTYDDYASLEIQHFIHKPSKVNISGSSIYSFKEENSYASLVLSLSKCATVNLYAYENENEISFTASSNVFSDLAPIVKLFNFDYDLYKWIVPYNKAGSYQLLEAKGIYNYKNEQTLLDTLYIHAKETNLAYTFNESLSPVKGLDADIYFTKGVLDVQPHKASYNKHKIQKGQVHIDFNHEDVLLDIDLYAKVKIEQDIIDILKVYDIPFPARQNTNKTDSHLKIFINLDSRKAYATGHFFIKDASISIEGVDYKIENAFIRLHKSILNIDTAIIHYKDIFSSRVHGQVDLKDVVGDVYFDTRKVSLPISQDKNLILKSKNTRMTMHFTKDTESYILPKTQWAFNDIIIDVQKNEVFLNEKFSAVLLFKDLNVKIKNQLELKINGFYNLKDEYAALDMNMSHFQYIKDDLNISKTSPDIPIELTYKNEKIKLSLSKKSHFFINQKPLIIKPTQFSLYKGYLDTKHTIISYDKTVFSYISTHYKIGAASIKLKTLNTVILDHDTLFIQDSFDVLYHYVKQEHYLDIPKYKIHLTMNKNDEVNLRINDFSNLSQHSNLLKRFDLKEGNANFTYIDDSLGIDIKLINFHPLFSKDGKNIREYNIVGKYEDDVVYLRINKKLDFIYKKKARLSAKNIDFNIFEISDYLKYIKGSKKQEGIDLSVKMKNCNIPLDTYKRKILANSINLNIKDDKIFAQLMYKKGKIFIEGTTEKFIVLGDGLNDTFMNELFKFSDFKGGKLSFVMAGSAKKITGVVHIKDTIIEDYTVLNNTLAFFNTIPSLVTFSIPDYTKKGLKVQEMYLRFDKQDNIIHIKESTIKSKELTITAKGQTNIKKEDIKLVMQVKTDIGSTAKNIPIIGYIVFGDDSISTTVRVHGPLQDPIIESSVSKSVIVAPYNILKRAIKLPFQAFGLFQDDQNKSQ